MLHWMYQFRVAKVNQRIYEPVSQDKFVHLSYILKDV